MLELVGAAVPELLEAMGTSRDERLIAHVSEHIEPVELPTGQVLFSQGDPADAVYLVVTGRLLVVDEDNEPIRKMGRGALVGEIGMLEGSVRTATVRADRDTILARLSKAAFDEIVAAHPEFLRQAAQTAIRRLVGPRPHAKVTGSVAVAVLYDRLHSGDFVASLTNALGDATIHVTKEYVDAESGIPGTAMASRATPEAVRREEVLATAEARSRFAFLEADPRPSSWTAAAVRRADRVLLVVPPEPSTSEHERAQDVAAAARQAHCSEVWLAIVHPADTRPPVGSAALAARYGADRVLHAYEGKDLGRLARLVTGTGTGLVLGGGGARGFAHIGVYRALLERGVPIDAVAGASIGAILGAALASGVSVEEAIEGIEHGFARVLDYTLPLVSLVKGSRITRGIRDFFGERDIEDLPLPFVCVSTNLTTSETVVHTSGPIVHHVRASLAIPGVIPPVPSDGHLLVDGGVLANLPAAPLHATGLVDTIIAVDVAPPVGPRAREDFGLSVSGWAALRSKLRRSRRYPPLSSVLMRSMIVGSMDQRAHAIESGLIDLHLQPHLKGVSLLAFDEVQPVVDAGYEASIADIDRWLESRS